MDRPNFKSGNAQKDGYQNEMRMEDGGEDNENYGFNDEEPPSKMFTNYEDNPHLQQ